MLPFMLSDIPEAGCDEVGRGCLCGPVCAAAVILPPDFRSDEITDSKALSAKRREALRPLIEKEALAWGVAFVSPEEIDRINILNASILAMHLAIDVLTQPGHAPPRRAHAPSRTRMPRLRMGEKYGLPHKRPSRGYRPPGSLPLPSSVVRTLPRCNFEC